MNAWTHKPTEPGLYLYEGPSNRRIPVRFDGFHFWIEIPEGMRPNGQRAIMFRPAGGLFWRIPAPPASYRWETARADVNGRLVASGDLGGGSSFEIREAVKKPDRPRMLLRVEEVPGEAITMPISGRWGFAPRKEGRDDET